MEKKQMIIKLEKELFNKFKKMVKSEGHTMTSWVRTMIIKEVKSQS